MLSFLGRCLEMMTWSEDWTDPILMSSPLGVYEPGTASSRFRLPSNSGMVTNSILFYWLFTINDQCIKVCDRLVFDGFLGLPPLIATSLDLYLCSSRSNARGKVEGL